MGEVGCYSLDLYCDSPHHNKWRKAETQSYTGRTYSSCVRRAKADGWSINRRGVGDLGSGKAICPECKNRISNQ